MDAVKSPQKHAKMTGLSGLNSAHCDSESPLVKGLSGPEIKELIGLWSRVYGRQLTEDQVLEIYGNIKYLAETLKVKD